MLFIVESAQDASSCRLLLLLSIMSIAMQPAGHKKNSLLNFAPQDVYSLRPEAFVDVHAVNLLHSATNTCVFLICRPHGELIVPRRMF